MNKETQTVEFKVSWKDDFLRVLCGMANAEGGRLYVGVDDHGKVVGVSGGRKLLEDIPNKILTLLGICASVRLHDDAGVETLEVAVDPALFPVSFRGKYFLRIGTTTQELTGSALTAFLLKKSNRTWDELAEVTASMADIDDHAVADFVDRGIRANRLPEEARKLSLSELFKKLHFTDDAGMLRRATLLAFAKEPQRFFPTALFKIGRFVSDSELVSQDVVETNLMVACDRILEVLRAKYLRFKISYDGVTRIETPEYPIEALREMIFNALVHRDYTGAPTQLRVYDDKLMLWNAGGLPSDVDVISLRGAHASRPRNVRLADIFFRASFIEAWGRGTVEIVDSCRRLGVGVDFEECFGGFMVGLRRPVQKVTPLVTPLVTPPVTPLVTPLVKELLSVLEKEKGITELLAVMGLRDRKSLRSLYINPALEAGLIERTIPDKPNSRLQKYRLTEKGRG